MTFKESVNLSNDVFFDEEVFAEEHRIEYEMVCCVLDTDVNDRDTNHEKGMHNIRLHIQQEEIDKYPKCFPKKEGNSINVDGSEYIVESWTVEMGVHVINAHRYGK